MHSCVEGHLRSFQLLDIVNKAAMDIVEHMFLLPVGTSSGCMPRIGIAGFFSSIMSNFLRNLQSCHIILTINVNNVANIQKCIATMLEDIQNNCNMNC